MTAAGALDRAALIIRRTGHGAVLDQLLAQRAGDRDITVVHRLLVHYTVQFLREHLEAGPALRLRAEDRARVALQQVRLPG